MRRIVYVSGKYRHYLEGHYGEEEFYDDQAMWDELKDEEDWCEVIAEAGMAWIPPLAMTAFMGTLLSGKAFIQRDCEIISRLRKDFDCFLLRPDWDVEPPSQGAAEELEAAKGAGLIVLYGIHGKDAVMHFLENIDGVLA